MMNRYKEPRLKSPPILSRTSIWMQMEFEALLQV